MLNLLHVYTGDGKGKTTAAMGLMLRALGHGGRALAAQFMKDGTSGELRVLEMLHGAEVFRGLSMRGFVWNMVGEQLDRAREETERGAAELLAYIAEAKPDLLVLDEICVALSVRLLKKETAEALIHAGLQYGDVVATGRGAPEWMTEAAGYVTRMEAVKHPFDEGVGARKGIEY